MLTPHSTSYASDYLEGFFLTDFHPVLPNLATEWRNGKIKAYKHSKIFVRTTMNLRQT